MINGLQEIFFNDPNLSAEPTYWYVPIPYTTKSHPDVDIQSLAPKVWIPNNSSTITHDVESADEWLFVNPDSKGKRFLSEV